MTILDELMGEYGFSVPAAAYRKLQKQLAARQPTGEPVAVVGDDGYPHWLASFLSGTKWADAVAPGTKLYTAPPAQGVDLGQFRELLDEWRARADRSGTHGFSAGRRAAYEACCEMLAALIDSQHQQQESGA